MPATLSEAPHLLDGMTINEAGRRIEEQCTDTDGFTDNLFGISAMLGYRLELRIRDQPSKRLYVFDPAATPAGLRPLVGGKALASPTGQTYFAAPSPWVPGRSRLAASYESSPLVRAKTIWTQRCAQVGLNRGEVYHALKNALRIGRQGEIRDRTTEGQHFRIAGLSLLTAITAYWNTLHLGHAVEARRHKGLDTPDHLFAHISPLGWTHILTRAYL